VPSAGVASVASTCSSPPALASGSWGSGGGGSGSVVSSLGADSSEVGVADIGFGLNLMAVIDLMKQNQLYCYTSRKEQDMHYAIMIYTYSEDFFMTAFFILRARGFSTTVLVAGGGVTPAGWKVPTTAMVTILSEVLDGSVLAVYVASSAGTSSPAKLVPVTFWRLGSGREAEGLQNRQCKHATTLLFDNSTGQQLHTWGVRLHVLCVCALSDNPEGPLATLRSTPRMIRGSCSSLSLRLPSPPGGSRFQWSRCRAEPRLLEPFLLRLRRWGEGGPVGGCRVVVDSSGTTLCVPAEDFQLTAEEQQNLF
jgi:hypothetical protein